MRKAATGLCLLLASCQKLAQPRAVEAYAYVTALQPPVWVWHPGERTALGASSAIRMYAALPTRPRTPAPLIMATRYFLFERSVGEYAHKQKGRDTRLALLKRRKLSPCRP